MATTQEDLNKITDGIKQEVKSVMDAIKGGQDKTESEIKGIEEKFSKELADIQRKVNDFQHVGGTGLIFGKDDDPDTIKRKAEFQKTANSEYTKICNLYGHDPNPVKRLLYKPRTKFMPRPGHYKLVGSYDGLEELMEMNDQILLYNMAKAIKTNRPYETVVREDPLYKYWHNELKYHPLLYKAMDTTDFSDLIPTQMSAAMIDDVRLMLKVAALFRTINLPRSNYEAPVRGGRMRAYLIAEPTDDDATKIPGSDPNATKMSFNAVTFGVRVLFSDDLDIDSIVPILPFVTEEVRQALADAKEDSVINGDDATTHQDSDVTSSLDIRKAYDGLRLHSGGSSGAAAVDISTYSIDNLRLIRKAMGRFGVNPNDLAWVMSISAYIQALSMDQVETLDKYGANATILTGELARIDNIPVVVSEFVRQDLNTSGVYDGTTTTDTVVLLVNRPAFVLGSLRAQRTEVERIIATQQTQVVTTEKGDFKQALTPSASEETVGIGYSLTA